MGGRALNIHSILTSSDGPERIRAVLRVGSIETRLLARDLRKAGFEVVWPPDKPCPR
jgi:acetoin utilization protein AcuB